MFVIIFNHFQVDEKFCFKNVTENSNNLTWRKTRQIVNRQEIQNKKERFDGETVMKFDFVLKQFEKIWDRLGFESAFSPFWSRIFVL